jgi:hypothetical protein
VLLVGPEPGAQISTNTISDTTCGIRAQEGSGTQVSGNSLTGSLLGITLLDNPATVSDNRIAGSAEAGATGISGTESADAGNVTFTVMANTVTGHDGPGAIGVRASDSDTGNLSTVTMDAAFNRITGNTVGAQADETATLNAETNWWGCNDGPDGVDCNDVATMTGGAADFDPWLVMGLTASPSTITAGGATSQVRASLTRNSLGTPVGAGFPDGTGIAFATTLGSIGGSSMTSNGMAASTLTSGGQTGVANVSGTLDNESVFAQVSITPAGTVAADVTAGGKKRKCKKKKYREKHPNKCKKKKGK